MINVHDHAPDNARILFPKAALELCLVQVRFPSAPHFSEERHLSAFKEELADEYPLPSSEQAMNITVTPQGVSQSPGGNLIRLATVDYSWSIVITNELVSLETRHYSDIDDLSRRFQRVLEQVVKHFKPRLQLRFGLRYINEFRIQQGDNFEGWHKLLNPELFGISGSNILGGTVEQTIAETRTRRDNGTLLLRHGYLQGTTVAPIGPRPPKAGPFYMLDLDYFDETPTPFEVNPTARMQVYNDVLYSIFRWCIGEGVLYQQLRGESI